MPTFIVDSENNIRIARAKEKLSQRSESFTTKQNLATLANHWPNKRLVEIWNKIPGAKPIDKFTDRKTAIDRIWKAIQRPEPETAKPDGRASEVSTAKRSAKSKRAGREIQKARTGSKKAEILQLLQRPSGSTLQDLMAATGWQAHSVRGFISASVSKRMGLRVESTKDDDGHRRYQIL